MPDPRNDANAAIAAAAQGALEWADTARDRLSGGDFAGSAAALEYLEEYLREMRKRWSETQDQAI